MWTIPSQEKVDSGHSGTGRVFPLIAPRLIQAFQWVGTSLG